MSPDLLPTLEVSGVITSTRRCVSGTVVVFSGDEDWLVNACAPPAPRHGDVKTRTRFIRYMNTVNDALVLPQTSAASTDGLVLVERRG